MSEQTKAAILLKLQEIADIMRDEMPGEDYLDMYIMRAYLPDTGNHALILQATNAKQGDNHVEIRRAMRNEEYAAWEKGGVA